MRREANNSVALAHTTASFTRAKKLDPLQRYLRQPSTAERKPLFDRLKLIAERTKG